MKSFILLLSIFTFVGCASMKNVENAEGSGQKKVYKKNFDTVWDATVAALGELKEDLNIEKSDKKNGTIFAHAPASISSYGEYVGIFIRRISGSSTSLEVVSKKAMSTNVFATDWTEPIFTRVNSRLGPSF